MKHPAFDLEDLMWTVLMAAPGLNTSLCISEINTTVIHSGSTILNDQNSKTDFSFVSTLMKLPAHSQK